MAKRKPNIKLSPSGSGCHTVEITSRATQYNNPIGWVCKTERGYTYNYVGGVRSARKPNGLGPVKTKSAAVLKVVKGYKSWIGLAPGKLRINGLSGGRKVKRRTTSRRRRR